MLALSKEQTEVVLQVLLIYMDLKFKPAACCLLLVWVVGVGAAWEWLVPGGGDVPIMHFAASRRYGLWHCGVPLLILSLV